MLIKKLLLLILFSAASLHAMEKSTKIALLQEITRNQQAIEFSKLNNEIRFSDYNNEYFTNRFSESMLDDAIIKIKNNDTEQSNSYFSLPSFSSIPGVSLVKRAFVATGSYIGAYFYPPKDWERLLYLPFDNTWHTERSFSYKNNNYAVVWLIMGDDPYAKIYDVNNQRLLIDHKPREHGNMTLFPEANKDGTCYFVDAHKDGKTKAYLYSLYRGKEPKIVDYERGRAVLMQPKDDSTMHFVVARGTKLEIYNVKTGKEPVIMDFIDNITALSQLAIAYIISPSGYILVTTEKNKVFVCDVEKEYARTEITCKDSFKLIDKAFLPMRHFMAIVDGELRIYDAARGNDPLFAHSYNGAIVDYSATMRQNYCTFLADATTMVICDIKNKTMKDINTNTKLDRGAMFNIENDCVYIEEKTDEKSDNKNKKIFLFYALDNGRRLHREEREFYGGWRGWMPGSWFVADAGHLTTFINPKIPTVQKLVHGGLLAWIFDNNSFRCWKSPDKKSACVVWIENQELKAKMIPSPDQQEFIGRGTIDNKLSMLGVSTQDNSYIFNPKTGEVIKQFTNEDKDIISWDTNNNYYAIIAQKAIRILDKNFNLFTTLKFNDDPVENAWFQGTELFKVSGKEKGFYFYVVNKDGVTEVMQEKK